MQLSRPALGHYSPAPTAWSTAYVSADTNDDDKAPRIGHRMDSVQLMPMVQLAARATAAVLMTLTAGACSSDGHATIDELASAMAEAYNTKDTDALIDLTCEADKPRAEKMDLNVEMEARTFGLPYTVSVVKAEENGDQGTVTLALNANNKSLPEEYDVSKVDGEWLICDR
nr:hypothetical protein [Nocardia otitidiscaviarum]